MGSITGWVSFVFLFIFSCFCMTLSQCRDTLKQGESIRDRPRRGEWVGEAQSLVSANQNFELGFFSPGNSNKRYIGIWYKKGTERIILWVANRKTPLSDSSGSLTIITNENLMIQGRSSDTSNWEVRILLSSVPAESNSRLTLSDSGNLILTEGNGDVLWQSFDHPSDTYLPGMKLRLSVIGRSPTMLTSWRSKDDPSPGDFTLGLDLSSTGQFSIWKQRRVRHWTSGFWNGQIFSSIPETRSYKFSYESDENGSYFRYSLKDDSVISRLVMDVSGQIQLFTWSEETQAWSVLWSQPRGECDFDTYCGHNGVCNEGSSSPCKCLDGFEPRSRREWESNVWSAGCVRRTQLRCGDGDRFMLMKMMRLPAPSHTFTDLSLQFEDCNAKCMGDCSCTAYASSHGNGTRCHLWHGELMGLQENSNSGQDLYVRRADFELDEGSKRQLWIIAPVIVPSTLLVFAGIICYFRSARVRHRRELRHKAKREMIGAASMFDLGINMAITNQSLEGGKNSFDFQLFNFATISAATDNFSVANKLGEGGFGPVYKGKLNKGPEIAVKRLSERSGQGLEEFKTEIILIARLQHMNLVRLLGCCTEGEEKILVYEYMPNKSLDTIIFDPVKRKLLDWGKRVRIINGIAQGLLYLHKYSRLRIIHRDLKPSNILLDSEVNPKISDFGMARIFGQNESIANTKRIVGTHGYMSPEYAMGGLFSEKSDVYSFGVLLLEIVSGKKNTSFHHFEESLNLLGYAWELWKNGRGSELIDPTLRDSSPIWEITRCIHMGLLCVQESAKDRPTMSNVAALLSNETAPLPTPKRPAFSSGKNLSMTTPGSCSVNLMTISAMEAR
ncbi:G-type lectin S-receptor-like serine/threonine-protein kinase B120 [Magnolia sinica]|uniref:G-type lectin S-receptor-like serine/threonine-protein kinase B120 n=1 Tax=Magnolia sinica TaxID=86752 RepID=UPI00265A50FC|nr:G-type lectin S-receptor-like serine/threonine-protein kinase B120 [Magnolia sinica]